MTIAGSDPSGGAGLQADLKTFHQHGVYGTSIVTLLTVQNTHAVSAVQTIDIDFVTAQLDAVVSDLPPTAAKTGALGSAAIIDAVAARAADFVFPLVVDPVMISKHGASLIDKKAISSLRDQLIPKAFLLTPNRLEAARLTDQNVVTIDQMMQAASTIFAMGARNVLVKGGGMNDQAVDVLYDGKRFSLFEAERIDTVHTHGTGCVLSAAITANLANGLTLTKAIESAKRFISTAIQSGSGVGNGIRPVDFHSPI
ncbi:Hydroxymethylpyrimidine/phosphomethylpyrimidine kinase [Novipirellula aureliae]|uniref:hydroxymethylpyrimidine kinase n=2 Tax=Novipirellula aureliae TaxID=2527966 RepID=A0A5C6EDQ6_9BACT|nr:Hydroxymethylpyrimidine/phosphomethylpyrimidine kinase [Novipirellula aureliae]